MDSIKDIVSGIIGRLSSTSGSLGEIQAAWERVSKDKGTRVSEFKQGCLTVSADSSMRLVKLNLNREVFLKELQKEFPAVIKLSFRVGR